MKKDNDEENKENEGEGIYLNPYQGKGLKMVLKSILNNTDMSEKQKYKFKRTLKNLNKGCKVVIDGDGIYLNPYKNEK